MMTIVKIEEAMESTLSLDKLDLIANTAKEFEIDQIELVDSLLRQKRDDSLEILNDDMPDHIINMEEVLRAYGESKSISYSLRLILDFLYKEHQFNRKLLGAL